MPEIIFVLYSECELENLLFDTFVIPPAFALGAGGNYDVAYHPVHPGDLSEQLQRIGDPVFQLFAEVASMYGQDFRYLFEQISGMCGTFEGYSFVDKFSDEGCWFWTSIPGSSGA